jgi:hypothetical protein
MSERDERGRLRPGHKGSNQYSKPEPQDQPQPDTPPFTGDWDDAVILVAETVGNGKPRPTVGLLGVAEDLRRNKSTDFASHVRQAHINRKQKQDTGVITPGITPFLIGTVPSGMFIPGDEMRELWNEKYGFKTDDLPPPQADSPKPSPPFDNPPSEDELQPPYTLTEVERMTKAEFDAAVAAGEIVLVEADDA